MRQISTQRNFWFWAELLEMTVAKSQVGNPHAHAEVWKNLVIISAKSPDEAVQKAFALGKERYNLQDKTLRFNGKPAVQKFIGVSNLGLIHEAIEDGAEICWTRMNCTQNTARKKPTSRRTLLSKVRREFRPYLDESLPCPEQLPWPAGLHETGITERVSAAAKLRGKIADTHDEKKSKD